MESRVSDSQLMAGKQSQKRSLDVWRAKHSFVRGLGEMSRGLISSVFSNSCAGADPPGAISKSNSLRGFTSGALMMRSSCHAAKQTTRSRGLGMLRYPGRNELIYRRPLATECPLATERVGSPIDSRINERRVTGRGAGSRPLSEPEVARQRPSIGTSECTSHILRLTGRGLTALQARSYHSRQSCSSSLSAPHNSPPVLFEREFKAGRDDTPVDRRKL